jgi:radical SAM protein with 4Fe4S-binding SPASM domain
MRPTSVAGGRDDMGDLYRIDSEKLSLHPHRVAQWIDGDPLRVYPLYVEISPNGACNHRCQFCSVDYIGYQRRQLDMTALKRSIEDMALHGVKSVMYAGEGEPLLTRGIGEAINWTKACGIDVAITTNATPLTEALVDECLAAVTWLKASVNGGTAEVYGRVHQTKPSDFDRVISQLAAAARKRAASREPANDHASRKTIDTTLGAQIVLLEENAESVVPLARVCRNIGLDYLVVKPYSQNPNSTGTAERGFGTFDYRQCRALADELSALNTRAFKVVYRENTMAGLYEEERAYSCCSATPFFWAYIMANGDVYACSAHLLNERFRLGNINQQVFSEIWEGERRRALIEEMQTFDIRTCRKNCRMEHVNRYLWELNHPTAHVNFI